MPSSKDTKVIKRGHTYEDERTWYFWDCEICDTRKRYLNMDAMVQGSKDHRDNHRRENNV
jgi:hypothetical protein